MRVAILGSGLIGGSLGMALRAHLRGPSLAGYDRDPAAAARARERGALDSTHENVVDAVAGAQIVVLAAPVDANLALLDAIAPALAAGTVVTDTGSVKQPIVAHAARVLPATVTFIGGHPMAGAEAGTIEAARADLFHRRTWAVCAPPQVPAAATERLETMIRATGAEPYAVDAAEHDAAVAWVSHLPHLVAAELLLGLERRGDAASRLAAGSFRDATRVGAAPAALWRTILAANRGAVAGAARELAEKLTALAEELDEGGDLYETFVRSNGAAARRR